MGNDFVLQAISGAIMFAWGIIVRYHPKWAKVPDALIPYMNWLLGLIVQVAGHATTASAATGAYVAMWPHWGGPLGSIVTFMQPALAAAWTTIITSLVYDKFGKTALEGPLGLKPTSAAG